MAYDLNVSTGIGSKEEQVRRLKNTFSSCPVVLIGAGAGLSTSAGLTYSGERFQPVDGPERSGMKGSAL